MMWKKAFFGGIAAGVMVGIGGSVFLGAPDKVAGAVLFSVALLVICYLGMFLYTGKVGYLAKTCDRRALADLGIGLVGNYLGATLTGLLLSVASPAIHERAITACDTKLALPLPAALALGAMCGILMFAAVEIYREKNTVVGIVFCIPTFILAGFEHSIADMFYMAAAREFSARSFLFLLMVVIGNSAGGVLIPLLARFAGHQNTKSA